MDWREINALLRDWLFSLVDHELQFFPELAQDLLDNE